MAILYQGVLAMMGRQGDYQNKFFITGFNLDKRIRDDHPLRKIREKIDFDFIYMKKSKTPMDIKAMSPSPLLLFSK